MSQVYSFIKQSQAEIQIFSTQNKGTSVVMYFPRYLVEDSTQSNSIKDNKESRPGGK